LGHIRGPPVVLLTWTHSWTPSYVTYVDTFVDPLLCTTGLSEAGVVTTHQTDGRVIGDLPTDHTRLLTVRLEDQVVLVGQVDQPWRAPARVGQQQGLKIKVFHSYYHQEQ
jgi:hypothetical protein